VKVCISSTGNSLDSKMDPRFGRASYFAILDTETSNFEIIENEASISGGGAGITSGQLMVDKGVKALVTGNVGPNAMDVLKAAGIDIYKGCSASLKDNLDKLKKDELEKINSTVPSHFGMGGGAK